MTSEPLISVCVAATRAGTLPDLVDSIRRQTFDRWELIVAAQGEDPALFSYLERVARTDPRISSLRMDRFGRSGALNRAVAGARGAVIAFTDDDCVAEPDWLRIIEQSFAADESIGVVAGDLVPSAHPAVAISMCPATRTIDCVYRPADHNFAAPPGFYWGGANVAVRHSVFCDVGGFDEYLGPGTEFPGAEDVDFCLRAEMRGVVMRTRPDLRVLHRGGRRFGLRSVLAYKRGAAVGSGALVGKLQLWNHRLATEWAGSPSFSGRFAAFVRNPVRSMLAAYFTRESIGATTKYKATFDLDDKQRSQLRNAPLAVPRS